MLGTRDYVVEDRVQEHRVIGLSGGIDSALVAAVAVAAIGKKTSTACSCPPNTAQRKAAKTPRGLRGTSDIPMLTIPIHQPFNAYLNTLRSALPNRSRT